MIITQQNVIYYLLERGLLTHESAVDGDLMVIRNSSNHQNVKVIRKQHPGYFIKQVQKWDPPSISSLQREAACYWLGHNNTDFASIGPLLPKYYHYDSGKNLLVIELLSDGINLFEYFSQRADYPAELPSQLGRALAAFHNEAGIRMKQSPEAPVLMKNLPWILTIHQQPASISSFNSVSLQLLAFIQSNSQFYYGLDGLQKQWHFNDFIHGDIKLDNYIIVPQDEEDLISFKIIDWELAGFGDGAWDLGSAFQAFVTFPIISMQSINGQLPANLQELLQLCSKNMRTVIREFWTGYISALQINQNAVGEYLERSIKHCAARMMQTAFECSETLKGNEPQYLSDLIRTKAFCLVVIALSIFQNPAFALTSLFSE